MLKKNNYPAKLSAEFASNFVLRYSGTVKGITADLCLCVRVCVFYFSSIAAVGCVAGACIPLWFPSCRDVVKNFSVRLSYLTPTRHPNASPQREAWDD